MAQTTKKTSGISILDSKSTISSIIYHLLSASDSYLLYVIPLPALEDKRDRFNLEVADLVLDEFKKNTRVIAVPVGEVLRRNEDWKKMRHRDGFHQGAGSVDLMVNLTTEAILKSTPRGLDLMALEHARK